jgi:hypothetical protein
MGVAINVNTGSSKMVRLVAGKLVLEESQNNIYIIPPKGECDWMITGYQLPFKMKKAPQHIKEGESEYAEKTRLEFTVEGGPGDGRMFRVLYGFALGPRATLGKFCRALGVELGDSFDLDNLIGYRGHSFAGPATDATGNVLLDDNKKPAYASISMDDRFRVISPPAQPYFIDLSGVDTTSSTPASSGATNGHVESTGDDAGDGWPT